MALPATISNATPVDGTAANTWDDQLRAATLYLIDVYGVPNATNCTAAAFAITAAGVVTISQAAATLGTNVKMTNPKITTRIDDANGNEMLEVVATASAVNHFKVVNSTDNTAVQLQVAGSDTDRTANIKTKSTGIALLDGRKPDQINTGAKMLFKAAVPTGWTQTADDDRALRVVSGAGGGTGGSISISGGSANTGAPSATANGTTGATTVNIGTHTHGVTVNIKFLNVMMATRD